MSWTRAPVAALAVCVLLLTGSVGCGSDDGREQGKSGVSPSPVGKLLDATDGEGRQYREVDGKDAPKVGVEVQPDTGGSWDVRLTVRDFRFSPRGAKPQAVAGRGTAHLLVDGRLVAELRSPLHRLPADLVPRGTHHVTARLYADDGTVWAVDGDPVQSTADITVSGTEGTPATTTAPATTTGPTTPSASTGTLSAPSVSLRIGSEGSPQRVGKAS